MAQVEHLQREKDVYVARALAALQDEVAACLPALISQVWDAPSQ